MDTTTTERPVEKSELGDERSHAVPCAWACGRTTFNWSAVCWPCKDAHTEADHDGQD